MRVLLDESLPRQLAHELAGHDVRTVSELGWAGLQNGELLRRSSSGGFEVFVTADQNLEYQQNLAKLRVAVIVVAARTNRIDDLRSLVPEILQALRTIRKGEILRVTG